MMPPVVYVGPTLDADSVKAWLPEAQVMPPIRRGDLYRDRMLGFTFFLILDGVFLDEPAMSPREVVDVIQDDGIVVGASSMGAIRAADCWPAGMRGVGSIYRLFRRGCLTSDDEVAVTFSPISPSLSATVALVTVRYALSRAVRNGTLTKTEASRIVRGASDLHYADRTWQSILESAGIVDHDDRLSTWLSMHDLKRKDAIRALKRVRKWIEESPCLVNEQRARPGPGSFVDRVREATHNSPGHNGSPVCEQDLWRWLVATGRYRRYASAAVGALLDAESQVDLRWVSNVCRPDADGRDVAAHVNGDQWASRLGVCAGDVASALAQRRAVAQLLGEVAHDSSIARAVWAEISVSGDMDAVVLRFIAVRNAARWARTRSLRPDSGQQYLALKEIAHFHGFRTWAELRAALGSHQELWAWIERFADEAALAKRVRHELFHSAGARGMADDPPDSRSGHEP
jgi:hypothetical protein